MSDATQEKTGSGNYFVAGNILRQKSTVVDIQVMTSRGSIENLDRILTDGEQHCDGAYVQGDALRVYGARNARIIPAVERAGTLYEEYAHFICNRGAGVSRITQLTNRHTVAIGPEGGWIDRELASFEALGFAAVSLGSAVLRVEAALAGVLAAPVVLVNSQMGSSLVIVVFAVVVIGGMGSILGSIVSGLALGLIEGFTKVIYPEASDVVVFVIMAVVLIVRPAGLFGRE